MPRQIFHVATIALMVSSQTNGKHTRPTTTKWEGSTLPRSGLLDADIISKDPRNIQMTCLVKIVAEAPADREKNIKHSFALRPSGGNLNVKKEMRMRDMTSF